MSREQSREKQDYIKIVSNKDTGSVALKQEVPEGTPGAERRDWTVGNKSGTKWEITYDGVAGIIKNIEIKTTKFDDGASVRNLYITIEDEVGEMVLSDKTQNRFAIDILKKLPSMDLSKVYRFSPYSFKSGEKSVKGVLISEGDKYVKDVTPKVENFFFDGTKSINGIPELKKAYETMTINQRNAYYGDVEDFLVEYAEKNIMPKFVKKETLDDIIDADDIDL